jgi:hypothetical protein
MVIIWGMIQSKEVENIVETDWIIILFFIYLITFWVEKLEESTCRAISMASPNLEIWVQKMVRNISEPFLGIKPHFFPILTMDEVSKFYMLIPFQ